MIKNYDIFLLEKLATMINESEVTYSNRFRKILSNIKSVVSDNLISIENKDIDVVSNYFDLSDNKESISFIPDKRAQEILKGPKEIYVYYNGGGVMTHNITANGAVFTALGYEPKGSNSFKPSEGDKALLISKTISQTSGKVYLYLKFDDGECVLNQEYVTYEDFMKDVWIKNRQTIRTGRAIRALLTSGGYSTKDSDIEDFVNKYKSAFDQLNDAFINFELVDGDKIGYWYNNKRYAMRKGSLSNSCMSDVRESFFSIYVKNPDVCKLLILKTEDGDRILGRALVWTLKSPEGFIFMDRVYTHNDSDVELFREYAKNQGWSYKPTNDSSNSPNMILPSGERINKGDLIVKVKSGGYDKYPYLDTLKYYNIKKGTLSTSDRDDSICLTDTGGGYENNDECDECGGSGEIECYQCDGSGEVSCEECDGNGKVDCDECDGNGEIDCTECSATGEVDCNKCDGSGKDEDGKDCEKCGGSGKRDCKKCKGGQVECENCKKGKVSCEECDGNGEIECDRCDGDGEIECPECS